MVMMIVETGGSLGHAPTHITYEGFSFQRWPIVRYFKSPADGD